MRIFIPNPRSTGAVPFFGCLPGAGWFCGQLFGAALFAACLVVTSSGGATGTETASETASETGQDRIVACLSRMEAETTWAECRTRLFAPCADNSVGSETHLACLRTQRSKWRIYLDANTEILNERLTLEGAGQLTDLLGQWFGYVGNRCSSVAEEKSDISADAARLGCEISEFAGLATEFSACLTGNSTSPYCTLKE